MLPYYVDRYTGLKPAIQSVLQTLEFVLKAERKKREAGTAPAPLEIEIRLGRFDGYHFEAGVSKEFMEAVLRNLQEFEFWHEETKWVESVDVFHQAGAQEIRTSRTVTGPSQTLQITHIHKKKIASVDLTVLGGNSPSPCEARFRVCTEEPASPPLAATKPTCYRIKQRKRFLYGRDSSRAPVWAYDLTCSWSGKTLAEAEQKKAAQQTTYEVELECLEPERYMDWAGQDEVYLATSMVLKCAQLCAAAAAGAGLADLSMKPLTEEEDS
jgi:hypothetical protein